MKDEMMAKIMDEVMKKMGGTQAESAFANDTTVAAPSPPGNQRRSLWINRICWNSNGPYHRSGNC